MIHKQSMVTLYWSKIYVYPLMIHNYWLLSDAPQSMVTQFMITLLMIHNKFIFYYNRHEFDNVEG